MDAAHGIHAECSAIWALTGRPWGPSTSFILRGLAQRVLLFSSQLWVRPLACAEVVAAAVPRQLRAPRHSKKMLPYYFERTKV